MLSKDYRLKDSRVIQSLFARGRVYRSPFFIAKYFVKSTDLPRFAFAVTKKVSKKAVVRNRIMRRMREAVRINIGHAPLVDVVIFGSGRVENCEFADLVSEFSKMFEFIKQNNYH